MKIILDRTSLEVTSVDDLIGRIWLEFEDLSFPSEGWWDFPYPTVAWWLASTVDLQHPGDEAEWLFMEGPFSIRLILTETGVAVHRYREDQHLGDPTFSSLSAIYDELVNTAKSIVLLAPSVSRIRRDLGPLVENANLMRRTLEAVDRTVANLN